MSLPIRDVMRAPYPDDAPPKPENKPWRVTAYDVHWYWGHVTSCKVVGDYRWYWQANLVSWWHHNMYGKGCNTWHYNKNAK